MHAKLPGVLGVPPPAGRIYRERVNRFADHFFYLPHLIDRIMGNTPTICSPLDHAKACIRLIKLKSCVKKSDPIICDLEPASLGDEPQFVVRFLYHPLR